MILVDLKKNYIKINGHANYDVHGKDIVCASVSTLIISTVNGISKIYDDVISFTDNDGVTITVLKNKKVSDILINNMIEILEELEKQYPKNIKIRRC